MLFHSVQILETWVCFNSSILIDTEEIIAKLLIPSRMGFFLLNHHFLNSYVEVFLMSSQKLTTSFSCRCLFTSVLKSNSLYNGNRNKTSS